MGQFPRLVVFDMAGTTVNDPDGVNRSFQAALEAAEVRVSRDSINAVMGLSKREAIRMILEKLNLHVDLVAFGDSIHADFVRRMIYFYHNDSSVKETPGTLDTFTELRKKGTRIAVNTGFSRNIAQLILDRLEWQKRGLIDLSVTSDEVPRGRPFPDMIRRLMDQCEIDDPAMVVKVGDTPVDLQEGKNAGCGWNIGVTNGTHTRAELEPHPHTHLIDSIAELLEVIA